MAALANSSQAAPTYNARAERSKKKRRAGPTQYLVLCRSPSTAYD